VCDDFPEFGTTRLLPKDHVSPVTIHLHFETQPAGQQFWESFVKKNENDGIKIVMEFKPQFWKENYGVFRDKFQHSWSVGSPMSDDNNDKEADKENCVQTSKKRKTMDETASKECDHCDDEPSLKRKPEPKVEQVSDNFIKIALAEEQNENQNPNENQNANENHNHNHNGNENEPSITNN